MTTCDLTSKRRQTKTPAALRHLLTERAAAAGALQQAQQSVASLQSELARLERDAAKIRIQLNASAAEEQRLTADLRALDLVVSHMFPEAKTSLPAPVRPSAGKYGARGALKGYLQQALENALPKGLTLSMLADMAAARFGVDVCTWDKRDRFKRVVAPQLRRWLKQERVTVLRNGHPREAEWRWRSGPNGSDLLSLAETLRDQDEDPARSEVGGQRAGRHHG